MRTKLYLLLVTAGFITSCEEILIGPAVSNDPISNFEAMWKSYDQYYGLFEPKEVDWQATYNQYRPMINEQTTDDQLKSIFHAMIDPLDDNHTYIITTENEPRIESGIFDTLKVQTDFSLDLIPSYVNDFTHYGAAIDYGTLADNIGYIHLGDFIPSRKYFEDALDQIIGKLKNTDGLVIDIRDNPGGNDAAAQYVAGRFAAERKLYMNVRKKSGPGPILHRRYHGMLNQRVEHAIPNPLCCLLQGGHKVRGKHLHLPCKNWLMSRNSETLRPEPSAIILRVSYQMVGFVL